MSDLPIESNINELSAKVNSLLLAYKVRALAALLFFSAINLGATFIIPKFGQIFSDALGSDYPLAPLTRFFLNFQTFVTCLALLWPLLGIILVFKFKNIFLVKNILVVLLIVVVCQVALTLYGLSLGMVSPMAGAPNPPAAH